jgi:hypothetical protein
MSNGHKRRSALARHGHEHKTQHRTLVCTDDLPLLRVLALCGTGKWTTPLQIAVFQDCGVSLLAFKKLKQKHVGTIQAFCDVGTQRKT